MNEAKIRADERKKVNAEWRERISKELSIFSGSSLYVGIGEWVNEDDYNRAISSIAMLKDKLLSGDEGETCITCGKKSCALAGQGNCAGINENDGCWEPKEGVVKLKRLKCPVCGWVKASNRFGDDRFYCPGCGRNLGVRV